MPRRVNPFDVATHYVKNGEDQECLKIRWFGDKGLAKISVMC